ncbi:hypothetical protein Agub_g12493, partial [Astrephomene gubernaculifera]
MPLTTPWSAVGLSRGLCRLRPVSPLLSCQTRASSFLGIAPATSRQLYRPSRPAFLGVASQLKPQQGLQAASKGLPKSPAASSPLPLPPLPVPTASLVPAPTAAAAAGNPSAPAPTSPLSGAPLSPSALPLDMMSGPGAAAAGVAARQPLPQQQQQQQSVVGAGAGGAGPASSSSPAPSPSIIHLTVASGAVVAPELDYTVVLDMLHKHAGAHPAASQHGGVVLGLSSPVGPTAAIDLCIGQLNFTRLLACARNKLWWMTPEWRTATWALPPETQFLLAELGPEGPYALLLPLIDGDFRATLRPPAKRSEGENGELVLRLESGSPDVTGSRWDSVLYIGASWDPYELVDRGVAAAAALSGGARPRTAKAMPPSLDGFGWCTWDAFYSTVSARGLAEGLSSLEDGGVCPQLLIIDDGWQMTDVDPPMRKTPAAELADKLRVEGEPRRLLEATQDEFFYESQEVMADTAAQLPPGTSAATLMPTLANLGPQHHTPSHSGSSADMIDLHSSGEVAAADNTEGAAAGGVSSSGAAQQQQGQQPTGVVDSSGVGVSIAEAVARAGRTGGDQPAAAAPSLPERRAAPKAAASNPNAPNGPTSSSLSLTPVTANSSSSSSAVWLARASQKVAGWLMGLATAGFLIFYQWVVEPAPPNSLAVRAFAAAAKGILRPAMLSFYANASDFTRRLTSVRANGKFSSPDAGPEADWVGVPEALGTVVAHIKRKFGVRYIYCWHGLPGYWAGVMPTDGGEPGGGAGVLGLTSHLRYAAPTAGVLEIEPSMAWNPAVLAGIGVVTDPHRLYHAMHRYLADCGVDGVKVDCQAGVGLIGSAMGGGAALSATYQGALEGSVAAHFPGNHVINCMCHSTENIYRMSNTAVARASDDFYPRDPASSHPHIAACAYNSLFLGALLQPDWDMFHSKHPAARLHAVARAVSGGPVYVSDKPGDHDFSLLHTLVLADGSVLRGGLPGRPSRDCLFKDVLRDGKSLLKVWNTNPVTGVVGVLHLQGSSWDRTRRKFHVHDKAPRPLATWVRPYDVDAFRPPSTAATAAAAAALAASFEPGSSSSSSSSSPAAAAAAAARSAPPEFAVFCRNSGAVSLLRGHEGVQVFLHSGEADVVTVARLMRSGTTAFACLGLANMINGGGALRAVRQETNSPALPTVVSGGAASAATSSGFGATEVVFTLTVRGHGDLLAYCSREPDVVRLNGARLQPEVSYSFLPGAAVQMAEGADGTAGGGEA